VKVLFVSLGNLPGLMCSDFSPFHSLKGATSRFAHLEKFKLNFQSSSFVIRVYLLHPQPSLFLYDLLVSIWCFSILVKHCFQIFYNLTVVLTGAKITQNAVIGLLLERTKAYCKRVQ